MRRSKLPPRWKNKRELKRFRPNLLVSRMFNRPTTFLFGTPYYELLLSHRKLVHSPSGSPPSQKVAIYLIFPTSGVQNSHLSAIDYIASSGYSPLVVSNLFLGESDRQELRSRCWLLIERPNYGYDFGGYRDGILQLAPSLHELKRLVLLNDSCWFPVPRQADWLHAAEQLGTDLTGAMAANLTVTPDGILDNQKRGLFYASFALMFSRRILSDPRFLQFWKQLALTNSYKWTAYRGEMGCSRWAIESGYSHGATYDVSRLVHELNDCEPAQLLSLIKSCCTSLLRKNAGLEMSKLIIDYSDDGDWKQQAVSFLIDRVGTFAFPYMQSTQFKDRKVFGFLKKKLLVSASRDEVTEIISCFGAGCDFDLRDEIREFQQRDA